MPPWAAFECERTGCVLEMTPTVAPPSAAASAARIPARPAPMTRTSCWGMDVSGAAGRLRPASGKSTGPSLRPHSEYAGAAAVDPSGEGGAGLASARRPQRPLQVLEGEHAAEHALAVDGDHRAEPAQRLRAEQGLERVIRAHPEGLARPRADELTDAARAAFALGHALDVLAGEQA